MKKLFFISKTFSVCHNVFKSRLFQRVQKASVSEGIESVFLWERVNITIQIKLTELLVVIKLPSQMFIENIHPIPHTTNLQQTTLKT